MTDIEALIGVATHLLGALLPAFNLVKGMADTYSRIKFAKKRCKAVIKRAAFVIRDVHRSLDKSQLSTPPDLAELEINLQDVQIILNKLANLSFFKALLRFDEVNFEIEAANQHLTDCLQLFQIELLVHHVQADKERAARQDHEDLQGVLTTIAGNYPEIRHQFDLHSEEDEDQAMISMERKLRKTSGTFHETVEMQLIQKSLECIKATTGRSVPKQNEWLITKYDLENLVTIGGGGFSTVSKAQFRGVTVAVKTLKDIGNVKEALESEVEIWSKLRHDHIVPFYGASTLTNPPYIISRYMSNGNLVQYLTKNPNVDRTRMVFEISLGMFYLHEVQVIHGDLKGVNVLVDDSGKACITDFGLSKVRSSGVAESQNNKISGTLRFLAPEALRGQPLTMETDVYAFGMLIYEVFTGEVPFIREPDDRVRQGSLELCRPASSKVYERGFNNALWQLLSECISREPSARPRFQTIQVRLNSFNRTTGQSSQRFKLVHAEREHVTNWVDNTESIQSPSLTLANSSVVPLLKESRSVSEQPSGSTFPPANAIAQEIKTVAPICIEVTLKYFGVKFGISSREPGAHLEENNTVQWQPIRPAKRSLLRSEPDRFMCQSNVGEGKKLWVLQGNDVILQSSSIERAVCHFNDTHTAREWFELELGLAKDGTLGEWSKSGVTGEWFQTLQSWRRVKHGKIQKAAPAEGTSILLPSENAWTDITLPKHGMIDTFFGSTHRIVCVTNPGKIACRRDGRRVVFETYRRQNDARPIKAREELYPSEHNAETMFRALTAVLTKVKPKNGRFSFLSF